MSSPPRSFLHGLLAVAIVSLLPGCSGDDPPAASPSDAAAESEPLDASGEAEAQAPDGPADAATEPEAEAGPLTLDQLLPAAAQATCAALFRCCNAESLATYFAWATSKPPLQQFAAQVPPSATLDEPGCTAVVAQMLATSPFKDWMALAGQNLVGFDETEASLCITALAKADCGLPVTRALHDGTCFGFDPPEDASAQRRMFVRKLNPEASCVPILGDGFGAGFYGTCSPHTSFCCLLDPATPEAGCVLPQEGLSGTCQATGNDGDLCAFMPSLALCKAGSHCNAQTMTCLADGTAPLQEGDHCVDSGYNALGLCGDGWCDYAGTMTCKALQPDGFGCGDSTECKSGNCAGTMPDGVCSPWTVCGGK